MNTNIYSEWLQNMMHEHKINGVELADTLTERGVRSSKQYISNLRRGPMSHKKALEIAKAMGWTLPGEDKEETSITITTLQPAAGHNVADHHNEVLSKVNVSREWLKKTYPKISNLNKLAIFSCKGDSMEPTFSQEDTLLASTGYTEFQEEGVYVFTYYDQLLVKRIQALPGKGYFVISDNTTYPPYVIEYEDLEHVTVHAKLVGKFSFSKV